MKDSYTVLQKSNLQFQSMKVLLARQTTDEWKKVQSLSNKVLEAEVEVSLLVRGMLNWKVGNEAENKTVIYSTIKELFNCYA